MISTGSMNIYTDAAIAYRRQQLRQDFAAINRAAEQRTARRARAAQARAAESLVGAARPAWGLGLRLSSMARWLRGPRTAPAER